MDLKEGIVKVLPRVDFAPGVGEFDLNMGNPKWEDAKLKICLVFLSGFKDRGKASTITQLKMLIREGQTAEQPVYIDFMCVLDPQDIKEMKKEKLPSSFGWCSYKSLDEFDIVSFSFSVHEETIRAFLMMLGSNGAVPMTHKERVEDPSSPFVFGGGNVIDQIDILNGLPGGSILDLCYYGEGEGRLPLIIQDFIKFNVETKGGIKANKMAVLRQFVEKYDSLYYPDGYDFDIEPGGHKIKSIEPKFDWVPKKVNFHRDFDTKGPIFQDPVLLRRNELAGLGQLLISHGCSGYGSCYFAVAKGTRVRTPDGLLKIEDLSEAKSVPTDAVHTDLIEKVFCQGERELIKVGFDRGNILPVDKHHKFMILNPESCQLEETTTTNLHVGDRVLIRLGSEVHNPPYQKLPGGYWFDKKFAYAFGYLKGGGYYYENIDLLSCACESDDRTKLCMALNEVFGRDAAEVGVGGLILDSTCLSDPFNATLIDVLNIKEKREFATIPEMIFHSPLDIIAPYLAGIFQAEGWMIGKTPCLTTVSSEMVSQVQQLLWLLGIDSIKNKKKVRRYIDKCEGIGVNKRRATVSLCIKGVRSKNDFVDLIGNNTKQFAGHQFLDISTELFPVGDLVDEVRATYPNREEAQKYGLGDLYAGRKYATRVKFLLAELEGCELNSLQKKFLRCEVVVSRVESIKYTGQKEEMWDLTTRMSHWCAFDSVITHQCHEGLVAGPWREKDYSHVVACIDDVNKVTACNMISYFSYNSNFHSQMVRLYTQTIAKAPSAGIFTMRADTLADNKDYLKFSKLAGFNKVSIALEGISERIRNDYLNKNLSKDQILRCCQNVFEQRLGNLKMNIVSSGFEEEEDVQEFIDLLEEIMAMRDKYGVKTFVLISCTALIQYQMTPVAWLPRKSMEKQLFPSPRMNKLIESVHGFKRANIKFNGGTGFAFQQTILDFGRLLSSILLDYVRRTDNEGKPISVTGDKGRQLIRKCMGSVGIIEDQQIRDYCSEERSFEDLNFSSMFSAMKEFKLRALVESVGKKKTEYCLRTDSNLNPKCYGCGNCIDKEFKKTKMINRELRVDASPDEVPTAKFKARPISSVRVSYMISSDPVASFRLKRILSHRIGGLLNNYCPEVAGNYYGMGRDIEQRLTVRRSPDRWSGFGSFDMSLLKTLEPVDFAPVIEKMNGDLTGAKVLKVELFPFVPKAYKDLWLIWKFSSSLSAFDIRNKVLGRLDRGYAFFPDWCGKGGYKEKPLVEEVLGFSVCSSPTGSQGCFALPYDYNPWACLAGWFKTTYKRMYLSFSLERKIGVYIGEGKCKTPGCQNSTGKMIPADKKADFCPACLAGLFTVRG